MSNETYSNLIKIILSNPGYSEKQKADRIRELNRVKKSQDYFRGKKWLSPHMFVQHVPIELERNATIIKFGR